MMVEAEREIMAYITNITEDCQDQWNALVMGDSTFAMMQSWEWGSFKEQFGWKSYRIAVMEDEELLAGAQLLIKSIIPGLFSMVYIPRGPVGDWHNPSVASLLFDEIHRVARDHRAIFLRIEPPLMYDSPYVSLLQDYGFKSNSYSNQPVATIFIDLSPGTESVMSQFHQKTRYNVRYAKRRGVTFRIGTDEDLPVFHEMMQITGERGGFTVRSLDYYTKEWLTLSKNGYIRLFIAEFEGEPIAVNMSAVFGNAAAYLHGGSSGAHSNLQPNYLIMWEAIKWAYEQNCQTFDLWGIPEEVGISICQHGVDVTRDQRADGLWGVYRFKSGFSQDIRLFSSAHDYAYNPILYPLMMNKYLNTNTIERIAAFFDKL